MYAGRGEKAIERAPHQEPPVALEARIKEDAGVRAGGMQQQLRFDAIHLRRVHQQLKKVAQQRLLDFVRRSSIGAQAGSAKTSPMTALVSS